MEKSEKKILLRKIYIRLILSVILWVILTSLVFIPSIKDVIHDRMILFTGNSLIFGGKIFQYPVSMVSFPNIEIFNFRMQIIFECTGFNYYLFALALVIFSPWTLKNKIINFVIYIAVIYLLNMLRFIVMGFIGRNYPDLFDGIHNYFWNILFALVVLFMWIVTNDKALKLKSQIPNNKSQVKSQYPNSNIQKNSNTQLPNDPKEEEFEN
jgi:exosortase/archaeosortase family protein